MKIDYFVLNNTVAQQAVALLEQRQLSLAAPERVLVLEDQIVPANDPVVSVAQQIMLAFARNHNTEYIYGEAMASHYLVENVLQGGELVLSGDKDILMLGAVGALGLCVKPEDLAVALHKGNIELPSYKKIVVKIVGCLGAGVDIRDAARRLVQQLQDMAKAALIELWDATGKLSVTEKMIVCGYCQRLEVVSASFIASSEVVDEVLDLSRAQAALPDSQVHAVFIGGAYGGTLAAIEKTAKLIRGEKIADKVRLSVAPASAKIYVEAANAGYLAAIVDAGGLVLNQCAVPPVQARIDADEIMLSNDIHDEAGYAGEGGRIFLTSTEAAVKAALLGRIGGDY